MSGERQWRWDGTNWTFWNGDQWVVGQPEPGEIPGVEAPHPRTPPPPPPPSPAPVAPASAPATTTPYPGEPTTTSRGLSGASITAIVLGALLGLLVIGGGLFLFIRVLGDGDDVVTLRAEPINSATSEFTPPVGTDLTVTATTSNGVRTVNAATAGLYGGTLNNASCNQDQLITFLQQDPEKAAAWAGVFGIPVSDIPAFVKSLTPVVLVADTAVTNHGFDDGKATSVPAVLQAGTAVLVDKYGTPTVKCYCGNPLLPPPSLGQVRYSGKQWPGFTPGAVTVVQASTVVIQNFVLVDVVSGQSIVRPAGSTGAGDTVQGAAPTPAPTTAPPAPVTPAPQPTTPAPQPSTPAPSGGGETQAAEIALGRFGACGIDVLEADVSAGSVPGVYLVSMYANNGEVYDVSVNVNTGSMSAASQLSAELAFDCPSIFQ